MLVKYSWIWKSEQGSSEIDLELYRMWWISKEYAQQKGSNEGPTWTGCH